MGLKLRRGKPTDSTECGRICFDAFKGIAERHSFPRDFPSPEVAADILSYLFGHPKFYGIVAELDGRVVGSNFLDERNRIAGIGPISVDPVTQGKNAGRELMQAVLDRAQEQGFAGIRLVQAGYNNQTLCLYSKLGFLTREPLSVMRGPVPKVKLSGYEVRNAGKADMEACNILCRAVHGHDRAGELEDAVADKTATLVERQGRITGYATAIGFFAHAVGETDEDIIALIGAVAEITGPGILVPTRNHALFTWCLANDLQLAQQMNLMTIGLYNKPRGAYLPSILY